MDSNFFSYEKTVVILIEKFQEWFVLGVKLLPNFVLSVLVIIIFFYLAGLVSGLLDRSLSKRHLFSQALRGLSVGGIKTTVILLGLICALSILGLDKAVFSLVASVGVVGLALGFAFKDLAANFISGIMLALGAPLKIGDYIEIGGTSGIVQEIRLRESVVRTFDGEFVVIPNQIFTTSPITNYTTYGQRRVTINFGISYSNKFEPIRDKVLEMIKATEEVLSQPAPQVQFTSYGASSVDYRIHFWVKYPETDYINKKTEVALKLKNLSDQGLFSFPFPIRTLDIPGRKNENNEPIQL